MIWITVFPIKDFDHAAAIAALPLALAHLAAVGILGPVLASIWIIDMIEARHGRKNHPAFQLDPPALVWFVLLVKVFDPGYAGASVKGHYDAVLLGAVKK